MAVASVVIVNPTPLSWFDQVDSGLWSILVATVPTQSGKSLACIVIPLVYHLFEYGEGVICPTWTWLHIFKAKEGDASFEGDALEDENQYLTDYFPTMNAETDIIRFQKILNEAY